MIENSGDKITAPYELFFSFSESSNLSLLKVHMEDISADNTVISTRLADAQISYVGHGLLGRQQKPGLITRFLGWLF